jgi:predicted amidophosphoribosyltransferase
MLSVEEWPAREACPHCKKFRVVDRERCEHCGAEFAPPEKNGTEVFESLAAVK